MTIAAGLPILFDQVRILRRGVTILDGVTLEIKAGAPAVVIGPNGSGKTTFLRAAMGLETPDSGQITWRDRTSPLPGQQAFMFQRPAILRRSVAGNVRYALFAAGIPNSQHSTRVQELLGLVGLAGYSARPAPRLSGGEQQRLALARALALAPSVLFLDEPTASLDPASTKAIEDVIGGLALAGIKIVMSTHDLGQARRIAGEIVLLHRGRVAEAERASEFFNSPRTAEAKTFITGGLLI
jgi:tungstate transport system ATP-binding protein